MIIEKGFLQTSREAADRYMDNIAYSLGKIDDMSVRNAYIQGRIDAVGQLEDYAARYNDLVRERNKLVKELNNLKEAKPSEDLGL